jgi:hypothetical protein
MIPSGAMSSATMSTDPRIDAYIAARAEFARPILQHLRARIHAVCPHVEETIKWSMPFFSGRRPPARQHGGVQGACQFRFLGS